MMAAVGTASAASTPVRARAVRWIIGSFIVVIAISVLGGIAAALLGGSFTDLGDGLGGLFGVPTLMTTAIALLAIPVSVGLARGARRQPHRLRSSIIVGAGAWIVAIGYLQIAHSIDPCVNGWWDAGSRIGDQLLCERFGSELNWHTRFHLFAHAGPAAALLAVYISTVRHWATPTEARADREPGDEPLSTLD